MNSPPAPSKPSAILIHAPLSGLPHERQFTLICTLLKRREVGTGKSKKLAKRQAAYKMWQALQDNPPESFQPEGEEVNTSLLEAMRKLRAGAL